MTFEGEFETDDGCRRLQSTVYPFSFTFSAMETPSSVGISSVNERGRGQFQSMHS